MSSRKKIKGFDLIRALCTIGIVLYHFSFNFIEYIIIGNHLRFDKFVNGDWGNMFVAMFFMLSGALLWYNHGENFSLLSFYVKRWLSIFPMFYLAWIPAYIAKSQEMGSWLWAGPRSKFLYTVFGMDGYFMQLDPARPHFLVNYYTLGEWFLGAILMLYIIFPLLLLIFKSNKYCSVIPRFIFTIVLFILFTLNLYMKLSDMAPGKHIFTFTMQFWVGMLIMEYYGKLLVNGGEEKKNIIRNTGITAGIISLIFIIVPLPFEIMPVMTSLFCGSTLMIFLLWIGEWVMQIKFFDVIFTYISRWSFGIFLLHHVLIYAFMKQFAGTEVGMLKSIGLFVVLFMLTMLTGGILSEIGTLITKWTFKLLPFLNKKSA